jgi:serine kinase of HPr protein (carbohydrate metabolism regulator)
MIADINAKSRNHHCSVVAIEGTGILIEGPSGSGKTSLALGLVDAARRRGCHADFITDDQALLFVTQSGITARAPSAIAGLAEVRGHGIAEVNHQSDCIVRLVARLRQDSEIERMPEPEQTSLLGVEVAALDVPVRHEAQAIRIILARLGIPLV